MAINFSKSFLTIIDANVNRAKEGIRVIEDISRFLILNKKTTVNLKNIRHQINILIKKMEPNYKKLLKARDSETDIGKNLNIKNEFKRKNLEEILIANFKRVQESLRVLEEISKLKNTEISRGFKNLRFKMYVLEKQFFIKNG
jgi:thiamine-phosphate pyrophosphorylase